MLWQILTKVFYGNNWPGKNPYVKGMDKDIIFTNVGLATMCGVMPGM